MKVNLKCPNCNHETTGNVWTDYGMTFVEDAEGCSVCPECHDLDTDIAFDWLIGDEVVQPIETKEVLKLEVETLDPMAKGRVEKVLSKVRLFNGKPNSFGSILTFESYDSFSIENGIYFFTLNGQSFDFPKIISDHLTVTEVQL